MRSYSLSWFQIIILSLVVYGSLFGIIERYMLALPVFPLFLLVIGLSYVSAMRFHFFIDDLFYRAIFFALLFVLPFAVFGLFR